MNVFLTLIFLISFVSCATQKSKFVKEQVCSNQALKYIRNPRNQNRSFTPNPQLIQEMARTSRDMQLCYEDFKYRTGHEEFKTCLVVGVDEYGKLDFYNFSSQEVRLDQDFLNCAEAVTKAVPFQNYGPNYVLIQSYKFYVGGF